MNKFYRSAALLILVCTITSLTSCGGGQGSSNADNPDTDNPKVSLHATAITATDTSVTITISKTGTVDHFTMSCDPLKGKTLPIPRPSLPGTTETFTENSLTPDMRYSITVRAFDADDDMIAENVFCVKTAVSGGSVNFTTITTVQELLNISNNLAGNYLLTENIDLANYEYSWTSIGSTSAGFTGILNGNGYTVNRLYTSLWEDNIGFFSYIDGGAVYSLGLTKVNVFGTNNVGSLAGKNHSGIIYNCYATGSSASMNNNTGGLVGLNDSGTIIDCYSSVTVDGGNSGSPKDSYYHGGLVGNNNAGTIINSYATGSVSNSISNYSGGLVGFNNEGTITNCYATHPLCQAAAVTFFNSS